MGVGKQLALFWSTPVVTLTFLVFKGAQACALNLVTYNLFYCLHTAIRWKLAGQLLISGDPNNALHFAKGRPETCKKLATHKTARDMQNSLRHIKSLR